MESDGAWRPLVDRVVGAFDVVPDAILPVRTTNNAVFRIRRDTAPDLALRLHRPGYRPTSHTRSELRLLEALVADGRVTVPSPLRTPDGDLVVELEDEQPHASVITWLAGNPLRPGHGLGPSRLRRAGATLARLHEFSTTFEPPDDFALPEWDVAALLTEASPFRPGPLDPALRPVELARIDEIAVRAAEVLAGIPHVAETYGIIHNDYILSHCLHTRSMAVIDFDDAGWGFYLQDLGGMLGNLKDYSSYRKLRQSFLDGYRSVRSLPSERESDLELMIALRHAEVAVWLVGMRRIGMMPDERFRKVLDYRLHEIDRCLEDIDALMGSG